MNVPFDPMQDDDDYGDPTAPYVLDIGSGLARAGMAGDDTPNFVTSSDAETAWTGSSRPFDRPAVERGIITDWCGYEGLLREVFRPSHGASATDQSVDRRVLLADSVLTPPGQRERLAELLFEQFGVPGVYMSCSARLALYSCGRTHGVVLDSGAGVTTVAAFGDESQLVRRSARRVAFGGNDLELRLASLLAQEDGVDLSALSVTYPHSHIPRSMLQQMAFVRAPSATTAVPDGHAAASPPKRDEILLPDGSKLTASEEVLSSTCDALFEPRLLGIEAPGFTQLIRDSVLELDDGYRSAVLNGNILAVGGNTMYRGCAERIERELRDAAAADSSLAFIDVSESEGPYGPRQHLFSRYQRVRVHAPPERRKSTWIGGSIAASLTTASLLPGGWATRAEYDESGSSCVTERDYGRT